MDPKSIANLDPKLRETYERVMGNNAAAAQSSTPSPDPNAAASSSSNPPIPSPTVSTEPSSPASPSPVLPDPQLSATLPGSTTPLSASSMATPPAPADPVAPLPPLPTNPAGSTQQLSSPASVVQGQNTNTLIKILYIFGGLVFFIVYIFFWIKIFNYQLPF